MCCRFSGVPTVFGYSHRMVTGNATTQELERRIDALEKLVEELRNYNRKTALALSAFPGLARRVAELEKKAGVP